jgi:hypothetical protein
MVNKDPPSSLSLPVMRAPISAAPNRRAAARYLSDSRLLKKLIVTIITIMSGKKKQVSVNSIHFM